jgi:hypothetical protein
MVAYIERRRLALLPEQEQRNSLAWVWRNTVIEFDIGAPTHTRYNIVGWRAWWRGRNVEAVLHEYGYMPEYRRFAPPRAATWFPLTPARSASRSSGSSDGRSAARSIPYPPPTARERGERRSRTSRSRHTGTFDSAGRS